MAAVSVKVFPTMFGVGSPFFHLLFVSGTALRVLKVERAMCEGARSPVTGRQFYLGTYILHQDQLFGVNLAKTKLESSKNG